MKAESVSKIITDPTKLCERMDEINSSTSLQTVKSIVSKLKRVLYDHPEVAAVCAPQIGSNLRLFVVKVAKSESERFRVFINPMVVSREGTHLSRENNLSFPNKEFIIPRSNKVHVAYQQLEGYITSETYIGTYGEVVQQMIEMLDGITIADYGLDLDDVGGVKEFDKATQKDKAQVISMYLDNLKQTYKDLNIEIQEDPELKAIDDSIKFTTGILTGEIKLNPIEKENKEEDKKEEK